jgi:hypothetical protein
VLAFWVGMVMAARRYPSEYEWRDMPVSRLLSPVRDPGDGSGTVVHCVLSALMIKERL